MNQQFFREHSEHWVERFDYKEAGPQLLLQAFLQRIINAGGRVEREFGLGRRRTDLLVIWPVQKKDKDGRMRDKGRNAQSQSEIQKVVLELKLLYGSLEGTIEEGLVQTWAYMDRCGADTGHLVIFDRDPDKSWDAKIFTRQESYRSKAITVWGM